MGFFDISDLFPDQKRARLLKIGLLVATLYPFYLLTCYMAAKGFYAYEMFGSLAGLVVPVLFMALVFVPVFLVFMVMGWGGVLLLLDRLFIDTAAAGPEGPESSGSRNPASSFSEVAGVLAVNVVVLGVLLYVLVTTDGVVRPLLTVIFGSLALGVGLVIGQHTPATGRAAGCGLLLILAVLAPMLGGEYTTSLVETILTQFRLGEVMVTVVPSDHVGDAVPESALHGRLVFLSASNLYLETGCPRKLIIVPRRDSLRLEFAEIRTAGLKEFRCEGAPKSQGDSRR